MVGDGDFIVRLSVTLNGLNNSCQMKHFSRYLKLLKWKVG